MAGRNFLFVPGPTNTPDRILRAMHVAMEDHRSSDFPELAAPVLEDLKKIFKTTTGQAFIFPASGTGAWEASLSTRSRPGDRVLAARFGMFSHLWIDMAQRLGLKVDVLDAEWGEGAPIERYQEALAADKSHEIKAVLFTHNETATGVTSDVAGMRKALNDAKHPALLMVDGVSSIASIDFRMDEWGVDCAVTGSQKGLMLPAGLGIVCASQKALALYDQAKLPRVLLRLRRHEEGQRDRLLPLHAVAAAAVRPARVARRCCSRRGWRTSSPGTTGWPRAPARRSRPGGSSSAPARRKWHSDTVSAIMVPAGINGAEVIDVAYRRYNLALGAGLARMAGQALPHRPPRRPERVHAARRHRRRGDGDARRGHQGHAGQRRRRGARSTGASTAKPLEQAGAAAARARCPARGRRRRRRRRPPAPADEPHARRARPPAAAAQRAGGAGLAARACSRRRSTARRTTSSSISRTRWRRGTRSRRGRNVIQALLEHDWRGRGKTISVRINGIDTHYMYRDVVDVVEQAGHRLDTDPDSQGGRPGRRLPGGRAAHPDRGRRRASRTASASTC